MWMNPLSNVMGGWGIWVVAKDGTKSLTTESFENVIMMVPFTALMLWTFGEKLVKRTDFRTVAGRATVIAFCFSLGIEFTQLLLRIGTFQLSDLFYNTLGGLPGRGNLLALPPAQNRPTLRCPEAPGEAKSGT